MKNQDYEWLIVIQDVNDNEPKAKGENGTESQSFDIFMFETSCHVKSSWSRFRSKMDGTKIIHFNKNLIGLN